MRTDNDPKILWASLSLLSLFETLVSRKFVRENRKNQLSIHTFSRSQKGVHDYCFKQGCAYIEADRNRVIGIINDCHLSGLQSVH